MLFKGVTIVARKSHSQEGRVFNRQKKADSFAGIPPAFLGLGKQLHTDRFMIHSDRRHHETFASDKVIGEWMVSVCIVSTIWPRH